MTLLEAEPENVEWSTIDQGLVAYYSPVRFEMQRNVESSWSPDCNLIIEYMSLRANNRRQNYSFELAFPFYRHAHQLPKWATQYFAAPEVCQSERDTDSGRRLGIYGLADFLQQGILTGRDDFVEEVTGQRRISKQLLKLRAAISGRKEALKNTVLVKDIFITFSLLVDSAETYLFHESKVSRNKARRQTKDGCTFLLSYLLS